jgi:hypothetical protein
MSELTSYPRVHGLLCEFLQLEEADTQLPLTVLVNLHRARLRAPLRGLGGLTVDRFSRSAANALFVVTAAAVFGELYPQLASGELFKHDDELADAQRPLSGPNRQAVEQQLRDFGLNEDEKVLIKYSYLSWRGYDHLVQLHRLTWDVHHQPTLLAVLERELALSPEVRHSVLEIGQHAGLVCAA